VNTHPPVVVDVVLHPRVVEIDVTPTTPRVQVVEVAPVTVQGPQGPEGDVPIVELTQAEFDALPEKDPETIYVITDGADRTVMSGTRPPTPIDGIDGDFWIDSQSWRISGPKQAGAWPPSVSMIGPTFGSANYRWKAGTANQDPGHGWLTSNTQDTSQATMYYMSAYDVDGRIVRVHRLHAGDEFDIYEADQFDTWNRYRLTGDPELVAREWYRIPVQFVSTGLDPFTPSNGGQIQVMTPFMTQPM
jgi:hypothetical protein